RVRDVFKESASDYDKDSQAARSFFAMAQDKFHYAITGQTAAQILLSRASSAQPNLGMTDGSLSVNVANAKVAKNYLSEDELQALENISEQFLLFAESKAFRGQPMTMEELSFRLNTLLTANDYPVLFQYEAHQREQADQHVKREVETYRALPSGR
ncbi:MAG: virulence RhuM family protein, partial [Dehalococcoidia bacterium]|nr:virulence RhuM family protein [Dehalococcoidia bacterium]